MHSEQNRALHYAVLASIVLHAALLSSVPHRERVRLEESTPLLARLVEPPAPAPLVTPPAPQEPVKAKPAPPKPVAQGKPGPAPVQRPVEELVVERAEPAPALPAPAAVPAPAPEAPPVIARAEPEPAVLPPVLAEPAVPPVLAPAEVKRLDPASVAQYRLQVISAARKFKTYPRAAMENNWEGDVVVRMEFRGNGLLAGVSVQSSSGHRVLDQQALEMFRKAAAAVLVPTALQGEGFSFEVRAVYSLKDQESG